MLDITLLRRDLGAVIARLETRKPAQTFLDAAAFTALESERKTLQTRTEELQAERNSVSKQVGQRKSKGEPADDLMARVAAIKTELDSSATRLEALQADLQALLLAVPNLPHESVPVGADEAGNVEVRRWSPDGTAPRSFDFEVQDHVDLGAPLGLDFEMGTKLTGSRFTVMKGPVARLHRALARFHARSADAAAWVHRVLRALHRQRRFDAGHRPVAQVRGRPVRRQQGWPGCRAGCPTPPRST